MEIFSDVLCPWSWGEEAVLRAIDFTFPKLKRKYTMGRLVDDYENFLPKNFSQLNSSALGNKILFDMFRAASTMHQMPPFKDIPRLFDEEHRSSDPLNIDFLTVREIDEEKANIFMRKLRERAIIFDRDIYNLKNVTDILREIEIDQEEFLLERQFAQEIYLEDRMRTFDYRIKTFPAFLIDNKIIKGYKSYNELKSFIKDNTDLAERAVTDDKETVYEFLQGRNVLLSELKILFKEKFIDELIDKKELEIYKYGNTSAVREYRI